MRRALLATLCLFISAAGNAYAESAWVLWQKEIIDKREVGWAPRESFKTISDCKNRESNTDYRYNADTKKLEPIPGGHTICLPDTVDPGRRRSERGHRPHVAAALAPHQSRPARDAARALERGGPAAGQGRVQEGARAEGQDSARGVVQLSSLPVETVLRDHMRAVGDLLIRERGSGVDMLEGDRPRSIREHSERCHGRPASRPHRSRRASSRPRS